MCIRDRPPVGEVEGRVGHDEVRLKGGMQVIEESVRLVGAEVGFNEIPFLKKHAVFMKNIWKMPLKK